MFTYIFRSDVKFLNVLSGIILNEFEERSLRVERENIEKKKRKKIQMLK